MSNSYLNKTKIELVTKVTAVTMATSHLMTGKHMPHFGLNSLISTLSFGEIFHTLPHHGNDIA